MAESARATTAKSICYHLDYTVARNCRIDMLRRKSNTQHLPLENEDYWHEPDEETPVIVTGQKRSGEKIQDSPGQTPERAG